MKRSFRIAKLLLACLLIRDFFVSCNEENDFDGKHKNFTAGKPIKGKIHIINYSMADGSLILRDDANQDAIYGQVTRNQKIKWVIDHDDDEPEMKDFEIYNIYADPKFPNATDFFSEIPKLEGDHWAATTGGGKLDPEKGFLEKYIIAWQIKGNPKIYIADPIMQLNPQ
jgi:hypothetical protein